MASFPPPPRVASPDQLRNIMGDYRGGPSPTPSNGSAASSSRRPPSKRDLIRSRHPAPKHVSKLESLGEKKTKKKRSRSGSKSAKGKERDAGDSEEEEEEPQTTDIGILADEVYDEYLPPLVAKIRRLLVSSLRRETRFLARHQARVRHPYLDRFFVYTSLFGTHSFFLIFLPTTFWVGSRYFGRGLVNTLAFGVYVSSAIKDLLCVPRPYSPPVTRLTIGSVHLEYGFLSTHSTNSVGMALYFYLWVVAIREQSAAAAWHSLWWEAGLLAYCFSVVYGRVYAGMHSIVDCVTGSLLGVAITATQWVLFDKLEAFLQIEGWTVPAVVVPACLFMVYVHPQPLDDCPCFEDAIAFISVVQGVTLARWASLRYPIFHFLDISPLSPSPPSPNTTRPLFLTIPLYLLTITTGVFFIFLTRVIVKTTCKLLLPSIFRFFDRTFGLVLPRRHYIPSSEYEEVPLNNLLRSPSFMDLPSSFTPVVTPGVAPGAGANFWGGVGGQHHPSRRENSSDGASSSGSSSLGFNDVAWSSAYQRDGRRDISRDSSSGLLSIPGSSGDDYSDRSGSATPISRPASPANPNTLVGGLRPPSPLSGSSGATGMPSLTETSQQLANADNSPSNSHFIQYAPAPTSSLSVPLTRSAAQGGAELPSDKVANALAANLSNEERVKQQEQAAAAGTGEGAAGEVKHYDIDVLTKVLVYTSIGFVAACPLPALFDGLGWTR